MEIFKGLKNGSPLWINDFFHDTIFIYSWYQEDSILMLNYNFKHWNARFVSKLIFIILFIFINIL